MQRTWIMLSLSCLLVAGAAFAEARRPAEAGKKKSMLEEVSGQGYGMAGCGVGSIVFGAKPGMIQIFAATTNQYFGQTFAITSGTSNCEYGPDARKAELFIQANREILEKDISRGNGEALANLSQLLGCKDANLVGAKLQQEYEVIFPSGQIQTKHVGESIFRTLKADEALSCKVLG